jgi:hypothetical protein
MVASIPSQPGCQSRLHREGFVFNGLELGVSHIEIEIRSFGCDFRSGDSHRTCVLGKRLVASKACSGDSPPVKIRMANFAYGPGLAVHPRNVGFEPPVEVRTRPPVVEFPSRETRARRLALAFIGISARKAGGERGEVPPHVERPGFMVKTK